MLPALKISLRNSPVLAMFGIAAGALVFSSGLASADTVEFESPTYYCKKIQGGQVSGDRKCTVTVDPGGSECKRLDYYADRGQFDSEKAAVLTDARNAFCGRRNIRELLSIAQNARYQAMSYVSLGLDETQCDPAVNPEPRRCNEGAYATYHLYMCAANACKYAR